MWDQQLVVRVRAELELRRRRSTFETWLPHTSPHLQWDLPHLQCMRNGFEDIIGGQTRKIMEFTPPQHGKSTQNSMHFPAYYLYKLPYKNVVVAACTQDLANKFSRRIRNLASRYIDLSRERRAASEWETIAGGSVTCGGIGVGTSLPIDLLIVDDPIKTPEQARSKTYRDWLWEWWEYSIAPRLRDTTSVIFTMTRWHQDDLASRILEMEGGEWDVICLPAICEEENDFAGRKIGEALWPAQFSLEKLEKYRVRSPGAFQALFQQRPTAKEGDFFKRDDIRYFSNLPKYKSILQSWDTAFKKGQLNDFSVCTTWGVTDTTYDLLHVWRKKCDYPMLKRAILALYDKFMPQRVLIEDAASGQSVVQELLRATDLPIKPIRPIGSKEDRAATASGLFEAGRIRCPARARWLADFTEELTMFPNGRHDDQIDSMTQALNFLRFRQRRTPEIITL